MYATLFDFDGVLVDTEPVHLAAFNAVLSDRGIVIGDAEYAERYLSLDDAGVFRAVLAAAGAAASESTVQDLVRAKAPHVMSRFEASFRAFPGAFELVRRRAARGPVGIVSGALASEIDFALRKMGLLDSIAFVIAADHGPMSKPDPAPYLAGLAALARLGHAGPVAAVEDSLGGIASANGAGLRCVAVSHAYPREALLRAGAAAVASSLEALDDALIEGA